MLSNRYMNFYAAKLSHHACTSWKTNALIWLKITSKIPLMQISNLSLHICIEHVLKIVLSLAWLPYVLHFLSIFSADSCLLSPPHSISFVLPGLIQIFRLMNFCMECSTIKNTNSSSRDKCVSSRCHFQPQNLGSSWNRRLAHTHATRSLQAP